MKAAGEDQNSTSLEAVVASKICSTNNINIYMSDLVVVIIGNSVWNSALASFPLI